MEERRMPVNGMTEESGSYIEIDSGDFNFLQQFYGRAQALIALAKSGRYMSNDEILEILGYEGEVDNDGSGESDAD